MSHSVKPVPDGYHTVTPYLLVHGSAKVVDFIKAAFNGTEIFSMKGPDGSVRHAEMRIGDSRIMIGETPDKPMPAMLHLYVENVDSVYRMALTAGGVSVREPENQFYGDRSAGVRDAAGNHWYIATHVEDVSPQELQRRAMAAQPA